MLIGCWPGRRKTWPISGVQFAGLPTAGNRWLPDITWRLHMSLVSIRHRATIQNKKREKFVRYIRNLDMITNYVYMYILRTSFLPQCPSEATGRKGIFYSATLDCHRHSGGAPFQASMRRLAKHYTSVFIAVVSPVLPLWPGTLSAT